MAPGRWRTNCMSGISHDLLVSNSIPKKQLGPGHHHSVQSCRPRSLPQIEAVAKTTSEHQKMVPCVFSHFEGLHDGPTPNIQSSAAAIVHRTEEHALGLDVDRQGRDTTRQPRFFSQTSWYLQRCHLSCCSLHFTSPLSTSTPSIPYLLANSSIDPSLSALLHVTSVDFRVRRGNADLQGRTPHHRILCLMS